MLLLLLKSYDCRGYLYDLDPYDADLMTNERRNPKYTAEEIEIEQACDAERYMFMKDDENGGEVMDTAQDADTTKQGT